MDSEVYTVIYLKLAELKELNCYTDEYKEQVEEVVDTIESLIKEDRELATIKVLGFYHLEVHSYVNKETWILTLIGIAAGMQLGWILGRYVMGILKFPSLEFYIDLYPISYLYATGITLIFAFIVNFITDRSLDKINMVEALKSVE